MATFKINGQLNVVFEDFEVEADSREEALNKLYRMDAQDILDEVYIRESDIVDEEAELVDAKLTFKVSHINYDVDFETVADSLELDDRVEDYDEVVQAEMKKIQASLPQELFITIDVEDGDDIEDLLANEISNETGWLVSGFDYDVNPDQQELYEEYFA